MAQQVTFIWTAVVEEGAELRPDTPNHLVRPAYRAAPIGPEIRVVRRDSRVDVGAARFTAIWTGPAPELAARFDDQLDDDARQQLAALGDELGTLLRFDLT